MEENLYNALLMAAAMLIFIIAVTTVFSLVKLTKFTSDAVLYEYDDTKYYEGDLEGNLKDITYTVANRNNLYRNVGMETLLPTVYRYVKENYGVTIIDKSGNIIARFDSTTESVVHNWEKYRKNLIDTTNAQNLYNYLTTNLDKVSIYDDSQDKLIDISLKWTSGSNGNFKDLTDLWKRIYKQSGGASGIEYGASFEGTDKSIAKRLAADFGGISQTFEGYINYSGVDGSTGILKDNNYKDKKFQEVFKIISDDSGLYTDPDTGDSVVLKSGNSTKLEIIYVMMN